MTQAFWTPLLYIYCANNTHRGLDAAMVIETEYKKTLPSEDDEDEEDDE